MGYTTDFLGHIDIDPPLNEAEQLYLRAFAESRRWDRPGGAYEVPRNPAANRDRRVRDIDGYNRVAPGQPALWCQWMPCWDGCCLSHDGIEKFYAATEWMSYLIDHFLAPHALAQDSGEEWFRDFTFDHRLDGIIAACRRDTRRLYLIRVDENAVREETLLPKALGLADFGPLPYEKMLDEERRRISQRRSSRPRTS
jgi:hypothetical protein